MSNSGNLVNTDIKVLSPKKTFAKFFFSTFIIVLILGVSSMYLVSSVLDKQLFNKGTTSGTQLGMLIPAEGMFTTDSEFTDSNRVNVLLLGTTKEKLSDTIMLFSYDQDTNAVDIISIPRDTYHVKDGYSDPGTKKINAAYWGDPESSAQAVHEVLDGIPINYYAVIDYEGVANIVDAIGGVEVDIPFDMNYEKHSEDPPLIIHLEEGKQTLNGEDAVGYLRYRSGYRDGDYGRVHTQQEFVKLALKQSLGLNLPRVANAAIKNVDSDMTLRTVLSLASEVSKGESGDIETYTLPGNSNTYEGLSFFFCDETQTEEMLRAIYSGLSFESTESAITGPDDPSYYEWEGSGTSTDSEDGSDY